MTIKKEKPIALRVVFLLNLFKIFLAAGLYYYFSTNDIQLGKVGPDLILYTLLAYSILFVGIVISIIKRKLNILKGIVFVDLLTSLPASAFAGIIISITSLLILFLNKKVKEYFS